MADSEKTSPNKLDHQIKGQLDHLQTLLQKKRDSEEAHNVFWPNCASSGEGYVGCNPLNEGECRGGAIPANGTRDAQCAPGHTGPKCSACDTVNGYVRKLGGACAT